MHKDHQGKRITMKLKDLLLIRKESSRMSKRERATSKQLGFYNTIRGRPPTGGIATLKDKYMVALVVELLYRENAATLTVDWDTGRATGTAFARAMKILKGNPHATSVNSIRMIWREFRQKIANHF